MTWLYTNSVSADVKPSVALQKRPYIDTPHFSYVKWLQKSSVDGVTPCGQKIHPPKQINSQVNFAAVSMQSCIASVLA